MADGPRSEPAPADRDRLVGEAADVAPRLLNLVLVGRGCRGRIVEVEAYDQSEPASHSFGGPTPTRRAMFGPSGTGYVYRSYGIHWCVNVVVGGVGHGAAVLIRSLAPMSGLDVMRARRPKARRDRDLCSGPGKLTQALSITGDDDGCDLFDPRGGIGLLDDGVPPPAMPGVSTRIGITKAADLPWRFTVAGDPNLSR